MVSALFAFILIIYHIGEDTCMSDVVVVYREEELDITSLKQENENLRKELDAVKEDLRTAYEIMEMQRRKKKQLKKKVKKLENVIIDMEMSINKKQKEPISTDNEK